MNTSLISELLQGIDLPRLDIDYIEHVDDGQWSIYLTDGNVVDIEADANARPVLYLSTLLGTPLDEHKIQVYETTLTLNSLAAHSDGTLLALDDGTGELMAIMRCEVDGLSTLSLMDAIAQFLRFSDTWMRYVTAPAEADAGSGPLAASPTMPGLQALRA